MSGPPAPPPSDAPSRRFAVGFSYAGEDRAVVAPLAQRLAERLGRGRVLFDLFHEAELARPDLDVYLPRLYRDDTELIVVVLSPDYPRKRWCGLEWRWIRQLIIGDTRERIMFLRLGDPGDLSDIGILSGDGFIDIRQRPAKQVCARILERLAQRGIAAPPPSGAPPRRPRLLVRGLIVGGVAALFAVAWLGVRMPLARWQVRRGDRDFVAYAKFEGVSTLSGESRLERAAAAWRLASQLDPRLAQAHARLGFLADILEQPADAEAHWTRAVELDTDSTAAAESRNGLANVLAQRPGREADALKLYDNDRNHPRSAIESAMGRWSAPRRMSEALEAINERGLGEALAGDGPAANLWGFKSNGDLLVLESRAQQRCLLANVRAATRHLAGQAPVAAPLTEADCQGVALDVKALLCDRLAAARANPEAPSTARWLGCPPPTRVNTRLSDPNAPGA